MKKRKIKYLILAMTSVTIAAGFMVGSSIVSATAAALFGAGTAFAAVAVMAFIEFYLED